MAESMLVKHTREEKEKSKQLARKKAADWFRRNSYITYSIDQEANLIAAFLAGWSARERTKCF